MAKNGNAARGWQIFFWKPSTEQAYAADSCFRCRGGVTGRVADCNRLAWPKTFHNGMKQVGIRFGRLDVVARRLTVAQIINLSLRNVL